MYSGNVGNLRMVHDCKEIAEIESSRIKKSRAISDPAFLKYLEKDYLTFSCSSWIGVSGNWPPTIPGSMGVSKKLAYSRMEPS